MKHTPLFALVTLALAPAAYAQSLTLNSGDVVTVSRAGTVGIIGGKPVANTTSSYDNGQDFYAVQTTGTAAFTLATGGVVTGTYNNTGLYATGSGPLTISGGTVTVSDNSVGVDTFGSGPVILTGGSISTGNSSTGLYAQGRTVTVTGGTITAGDDARDLSVYYSAPLTISGGTFTVGDRGIGLTADSSSPVTITGGTFTVGAQGYGLSAFSSTIDLYGAFDGLTLGQTLTLPSDFTNGVTGSFFGTLENNTIGQTFTYLNKGTITLHDVGLAAAPEPSQFAAFGVGLLGLGALALRARKRQAA